MWDLDHNEAWAPKNWWFWTVVLEKALESPLDSREIKPVHPKGNKSGIVIGRTDAEAEAPILWPHDAKSWLIGKYSDAGKDWRQEKGTTQDETVGWHHQLNGHEFEQGLGDGDGQGSLACCSPLDCRVRHDWATEQQMSFHWALGTAPCYIDPLSRWKKKGACLPVSHTQKALSQQCGGGAQN